MGVWIICSSCKRHFYWSISEEVGKNIIPVVIKDVDLQNVGILRSIQNKEKNDLNVDGACSHWYKYGPWYNKKTRHNFYGRVFEVF